MPRFARPHRLRRAGALAAAPLLLVGCGGSDADPATADTTALLARAQEVLTSTNSVRVVFSGAQVPSGGANLSSGKGVAARPPAFQGSVSLMMKDGPLTVEVVSVGGDVFTKLPTEQRYKPADPAGLGFSDPAMLLDEKTGLPRFVTELSDVEAAGEDVIDGETVQKITGELPGSLIERTLTSADPSAPVKVTAYLVKDSAQLRRAVLTGPFYEAGEDSTMTVVLDEYGAPVSIVAPTVAP